MRNLRRTFVFAMGLGLAFLGGCAWDHRSTRSAELLRESLALARICEDAMRHRARPKRVADRVRQDLGVPIELDRDGTVIVLPAHRDGSFESSRWVLNLTLDRRGRCENAWLEFQQLIGAPGRDLAK